MSQKALKETTLVKTQMYELYSRFKLDKMSLGLVNREQAEMKKILNKFAIVMLYKLTGIAFCASYCGEGIFMFETSQTDVQ